MTAALYHAALVERAKAAFGKGRLSQPTTSVTLDNPLCGDRVTLDIVLSDGRLAQIGHQVRGCLLCEAAAATIAENCSDQSVAQARAIIPAIRTMMQDGLTAGTDWPALEIFTPVHASKSRRDCVLLPFAALEKALDQAG
ncbi:MAG TPA: iron-sulfur cluster assembly scaffold protein [Dongiaceae bacterium]|nr:iron-sulfur cluster assembly scaffold protein [Dongiaceae bacterium]